MHLHLHFRYYYNTRTEFVALKTVERFSTETSQPKRVWPKGLYTGVKLLSILFHNSLVHKRMQTMNLGKKLDNKLDKLQLLYPNPWVLQCDR